MCVRVQEGKVNARERRKSVIAVTQHSHEMMNFMEIEDARKRSKMQLIPYVIISHWIRNRERAG